MDDACLKPPQVWFWYLWWVCSLLWCPGPESLAVRGVPAAAASDTLAESGCPVGGSTLLHRGHTPGHGLSQTPKPSPSLGFRPSQGIPAGLWPLEGAVLRGGSPAFWGPGLGFLPLWSGEAVLIKIHVFWHQRTPEGREERGCFCVFLVFL